MHFFSTLIKKISGIKKVNTSNGDINISTNIFLVTKSKKDCQFWYSQRENGGRENNTANKFYSNKDSSKGSNSSDFDFNHNVIEKNYRNCRWNKAVIAIVSFCMMAYARNKYINLIQMVTGYFSYAHNVSKKRTEVYYKINLIVS